MGNETEPLQDSEPQDLSKKPAASLAEIFDTVVKTIKELPKEENDLSHQEKLQLYGCYKQVTAGNCPENRAPSMFQLEAHAKYNAWEACRGMSSERAMKDYLDIISRCKHASLSSLCQKLLADFETSQGTKDAATMSSVENVGSEAETCVEEDNQHSQNVCESSLYRRRKTVLGIKPLIPRGQLDISYFDLAFAAVSCCFLAKSAFAHYESRIREKWESLAKGSIPIVGFSVRTLLDLYLRCKQFPPESEIIVTPPITVPGMLHVLEHHRLKVIGVDLPINDELIVGVDCDAVKSAITSKTTAIMVVHAFGMMTATEDQMQELRSIADSKNLELWEDCAETFVGLGDDCYLGNPTADLRFFSFGVIKTCTAGGGGVFLCRDHGIAAKAERVYRQLYDTQSNLAFLFTISKMLLMKIIADSPYLYGLLAAILGVLRIELDDFVTKLSRNFILRNRSHEKNQFCPMMAKIRRRPSVPMLSLLDRNFSRASSTLESVTLRQVRSLSLDALIKTNRMVQLPRPKEGASSTCWLYPICHDSPAEFCSAIRAHGFDATRGATQLCCVSSPAKTPRCHQLMNQIVYIPNSAKIMSEDDVGQLATLVKDGSGCCGSYSPFQVTAKACPSRRFWVFSVLMVVTWSMSLRSFLWFLLLATKGAMFALLVATLILTALRQLCGPRYLRSKALSRFPWMVTKRPGSSGWRTRGKSLLDEMPELAFPTSTCSNRRTKIILTGATGFIGSMLLHDILQNRERLGVETVIIFCRSKRNKSAKDRISQMSRNPMFSLLTEAFLSSIRVIECDLASTCLGITDSDMQSLLKDHSISHIFNCAASVGFNQSLPEAARSNIAPSLLLQNLAARINPRCKFIHLSTAFVHGDQAGTRSDPLREIVFDFGRFNVHEIYKSMIGTQFYASKAMQKLGFPNSYTFSKSVCEHLLTQQAAAQTTIIRPSIVGPSLESPWESWAGDKPSTLVGAASLYFSYQGSLWPYSGCTIPCIPVDVVSRYILSKAFTDEQQNYDVSDSDSSWAEDYEKIEPQKSTSDSHDSDDSDDRRRNRKLAIYTAAWDSHSHPIDFTWLDFAGSVFQFGVVFGYFSSLKAYTSILATMLLQGISHERFRDIHRLIVQIPHRALFSLFALLKIETRSLEKAGRYLDLPLLFFPFMTRTFYFQSEVRPPVQFDSERYLFICAISAASFVEREKVFISRNDDFVEEGERRSRLELLAGSSVLPSLSDLSWAISQPNGNLATRVAAWVTIKLLRMCFDEITADLTAIGQLHSELMQRRTVKRIVLAPTHRSFFDFVLISFACFAIPELQMKLPKIAAADDFKGVFWIGWFMNYLGAFFVRRGVGKSNPLLNEQLHFLDSQSDDSIPIIELFVEGARSRDRRFGKPRTGFLRALPADGDTLILPICISYEALAEQSALANEAATGGKTRLSLTGTLLWMKNALCGKIKLGKAHIAFSESITLGPQGDCLGMAREIQRRQQQLVVISDYHLRAGEIVLDVSKAKLKECLYAMGCGIWPEYKTFSSASLPQDLNELWTIFLQGAPYFEPLVRSSDRTWANWLNPTHKIEVDSKILDDISCVTVAEELRSYFRACDVVVDTALKKLRGLNVSRPKPYHVLQTATSLTEDYSPMLLLAAITFHTDLQTNLDSEPANKLRVEAPESPLLRSGERLGFWGLDESRFIMRMDDMEKPIVVLEGSRYSLAGKNLRRLLPFIEQEMSVNLTDSKDSTASSVEAVCYESVLLEHLHILTSSFSFVSYDCKERIRHCTGHSQHDIFEIRFGNDCLRAPDVVIWPVSEAEVRGIISLAIFHKWCIIPFGGGTNVTQATKCPTLEEEPRPIVSVDMTKMNKIRRVDEENGYIEVEAGITGRKLADDLRRLGYTMGHEPDSYEFSTLGGWIATKASGMKRSKYGNIEDMVLSVSVMNASGILEDNQRKTCIGRVSCGPELRPVMFGSEGCFGIVVKASVRIWPLPQCSCYDSFLFPDFAAGVAFARQVARLGSSRPVSVRVLDNDHFRLGQALQPTEDSPATAVWKMVKKLMLKALCDFKDNKVCCATITYEGERTEVDNQKKILSQIALEYCAVSLGASVGKAAYDMTFMIAYLRDFALSYSIIGESFETFAPWSAVNSIIEDTKTRIRKEFKKRCLPGKPFIGCRITQLYHEGACLYFYFCMSVDGINNPSKIYDEIEHSARCEILKSCGSLSHHHGLGKVRSHLLKETQSDATRSAILAIKTGLDPENIFGARNGPFAN